MQKILTIIIPTYNMEKYLNKCLTSLIISDDELMKQLEVLVVIDGAKDQSSNIAHEFEDKYPDTFRVIDKENGNYGSCINRGLKEANGKYVKVLDADDYFETDSFQKYLKALLNQDNDLVITDFEYVNEQYKVTGNKGRILPYDITLSFSDVVGDFNSNLISMHELTYRTSIFRELSYHQTEGISYTDLEWCFLPMTKVNSVLCMNLVVYKYLIGREGQTIAPEVVVRTLSHKMLSGTNMAKQYEGLKAIKPEYKSYLNRRISWSMGAIYYNYLVSYRKVLPTEELIQFDQSLKSIAPTVYKLLDDEVLNPKIRIHYIRKWRNQNELHRIPKSVKIGDHLISLYKLFR